MTVYAAEPRLHGTAGFAVRAVERQGIHDARRILMDNLPLLESEQEELLIRLVEASRRVSRENREKFVFTETSSGSKVRHPGFGESALPAYRGDIQVLAGARVLQVTAQQHCVLFDVTPLGFRVYSELKGRAGHPIERLQAEIRSFLESHAFQAKYPLAYRKWSEAESLLWGVETEQQATTVGHLVREAIQEFAEALVQRYNQEDAGSGKAETVRRIRAVLKENGLGGETEGAFLEALIAYWGTVSDLIQRQEHGAQKEGEPLEWEDGRRVVFQAAIVMFEVERALS